MTEKLYYKDAYIRCFDANVIECTEIGDKYRVILDATAFFPEEGGQASDTGYIGDAKVTKVIEKQGIIYHEVDRPLPLGNTSASLDFDLRFEKMQCHTAEHILCGIIHSKYGFENVGFHLGDELVTFDVDGELNRAELDEIERLANEAVFANLAVSASYPTADELATLTYRAKLDITDGVRIVTIDTVDSCACCAPHVSRTGEIGIIKLLDFMRHRGGTRIFMLAGRRALADYHHKYLVCKDIGALTSTPHNDILEPVHLIHSDLIHERACSKSLRRKIADLYSLSIQSTDGNIVLLLNELEREEMREMANSLIDKVSGITLLLSGQDGGYKYIIASKTVDIPATVRAMNADLGGKGGGRGDMAEGTVTATLDQIKAYFA